MNAPLAATQMTHAHTMCRYATACAGATRVSTKVRLGKALEYNNAHIWINFTLFAKLNSLGIISTTTLSSLESLLSDRVV